MLQNFRFPTLSRSIEIDHSCEMGSLSTCVRSQQGPRTTLFKQLSPDFASMQKTSANYFCTNYLLIQGRQYKH